MTSTTIQIGAQVKAPNGITGTVARIITRSELTMAMRPGEEPDALVAWVDFSHNADGAYYYTDMLTALPGGPRQILCNVCQELHHEHDVILHEDDAICFGCEDRQQSIIMAAIYDEIDAMREMDAAIAAMEPQTIEPFRRFESFNDDGLDDVPF